MIVYGIPNCDTVKKALDWFKANQIDFEFHNFKKEGISPQKLQEWCTKAGYDKVINKASATFKALNIEVKENLSSPKPALELVQANTSMIKRPVIEDGGFLFFGFDENIYKMQFLPKK